MFSINFTFRDTLMMTDKQDNTVSTNVVESDKLELTFLTQLKKEEEYINSIACPSKAVIARSARIQELIKLLS